MDKSLDLAMPNVRGLNSRARHLPWSAWGRGRCGTRRNWSLGHGQIETPVHPGLLASPCLPADLLQSTPKRPVLCPSIPADLSELASNAQDSGTHPPGTHPPPLGPSQTPQPVLFVLHQLQPFPHNLFTSPPISPPAPHTSSGRPRPSQR